jgi:hypothetical protein
MINIIPIRERYRALLPHLDERGRWSFAACEASAGYGGIAAVAQVRCELDTKDYPKGIAVSDRDMATINVLCDQFHGDWNYTIRPRNQSGEATDP